MSPEPVGSTHLRFGDARVVTRNGMWLPKVVRSPGYDHGHDEESRNGRDIKIDILETIFGHRKCSGEVSDKTGVPAGYRNPRGN